MGNQVSGLLPASSFLYRLAYSFTAGDMPTLVLNPKGFIQSKWGQRDFTELPKEEEVLTLIKNLRAFYLDNRDFMCFGNMVKPLPYTTQEIVYPCEYGRSYIAEEVLSTAFEYDGKKIQIFVNYNNTDKTIEWQGERILVKAFSVGQREI